MSAPLPTTYLFVPATRPERVDKAFEAGAHAVIIDLEDAIDPADKAAARERLGPWLAAAPAERKPWVRVNAVDTAWFREELKWLQAHAQRWAGVVLPKVEKTSDIDALSALADVPVMALIESARGLLGLAPLAAHPRVHRLAFGSADLSRDLGCEDSWAGLLPHRASLVLHASAAGLPPPVDGVSFALDRPDAVEHDAREAMRLGFGAKLCIHPAQLAPCERGFAPTEAQRQWAEQVLLAAERGAGAQRVGAQMIDRPVIERARQLLQRLPKSP